MSDTLPDWSHLRFRPVVVFPQSPVVLDLTAQGLKSQGFEALWSVGRYDEDRAIYVQELFSGERRIHLGIDLGGPVGVAVHAFASGEVCYSGYNPADGDYGHVVVTRHRIEGRTVFALFGHLSEPTLGLSPVGRRFQQGEVLGWLGDRHENGGWPPHVHVQLSWDDPGIHDMPGAATAEQRAELLGRYPDPRIVLGPLYS